MSNFNTGDSVSVRIDQAGSRLNFRAHVVNVGEFLGETVYLVADRDGQQRDNCILVREDQLRAVMSKDELQRRAQEIAKAANGDVAPDEFAALQQESRRSYETVQAAFNGTLV